MGHLRSSCLIPKGGGGKKGKVSDHPDLVFKLPIIGNRLLDGQPEREEKKEKKRKGKRGAYSPSALHRGLNTGSEMIDELWQAESINRRKEGKKGKKRGWNSVSKEVDCRYPDRCPREEGKGIHSRPDRLSRLLIPIA